MKNPQRFTSLFFSDIVGYSQMIASDESHALNLLDEHDIILKKYIKEQSGTIIKHIGDAIFAEFPTQKNAIDASLGIQRHLKKRNDNYAKKDKIMIRIGLHCGTVVEKDNDLFGNDVNLCARIEGCAIPEGIAGSSQIVEGLNIKHKRSYGYVRLKNIPSPHTLYRIYCDEDEFRSQDEEKLHEILVQRGLNLVDSDKVVHSYKTFSFLYPNNLGEEKHEFICFEFVKQLISDSNKISEIRASSISDVLKHKDENDISLISTKLASEYIVELRLHCADTSMSVDAEVTSINDLSVIYSNSFKGDINQLKTISGKILLEMLTEIGVEIDDDLKSLFNQKTEVDSKAYKLFLEGKSLSDQTSGATDLKKSKEILEDAIDIDDNFPEAYAVLGMTFKLLGEFDDAEEMLDEALELMDDIDDPETLAMINSYFGIYHRDAGNPKKSIKFFEKALKSQKKIGDKLLQADIYNNMSMSHGLLQDNKQMINLIERAQKIYSDYDELLKLANSYGMEASYHMNKQDHLNAIKFFDRAKSMFLNQELYFKYAQCLVLQSQCHLSINEPDEAKLKLESARQHSEGFKNPMMDGKIYFNLAQVNIIEKNYDTASENIDDALEIFQDLNNKIMLSQLHIMQGNMYMDIEKIKKAKRALEKAKKYSRRIKSDSMNDKISNLEYRITS